MSYGHIAPSCVSLLHYTKLLFLLQLEVGGGQQQNSMPTVTSPPPQVTAPPPPVTAPPTAAPPTITPTIGTVQAQSVSGQKQMVEVKSLGQNTVTFKGNQMIVSGPDIAQAQQIGELNF